MRSTPRHETKATAQAYAGPKHLASGTCLTGGEPLPQAVASTIEGELAGLAEISTLLRDMASQIADRLGDPKPTGPEEGTPLGMSVVDRLRAFRNTLIAARGHLEAAFNTLG